MDNKIDLLDKEVLQEAIIIILNTSRQNKFQLFSSRKNGNSLMNDLDFKEIKQKVQLSVTS